MSRERILLVDDDLSVLDGLTRALTRQHFEVSRATDGETCLQLVRAAPPDAIVLDVVLPGVDGLTVCAQLRAVSSVPILMLTARGTLIDKVTGLERGADDYLVKPFSVEELVARLRAMLRRTPPARGDVLEYEDLSINLQTRRVYRDGQPIPLTHREFELLRVFVTHPDQALTRDQLCLPVWGHTFDSGSNFVDVTLGRLRRKLEAGGRPRLIHAIRGFGYALRGSDYSAG